MNDNRRTGRTTRLLRLACLAAKAGGKVAFVVIDDKFIPYAIERCREARLLEEATYSSNTGTLLYRSGGMVHFTVDGQEDRHRGVHFDAMVLDHSARDAKVEKAESMIRYALDIMRDAAAGA